MFANGPGDRGSILGRVIPKTFKMVLDTFLLNTQQYKARIKGKVDQSRERSCAFHYTLEEIIEMIALDYGRQLYLYDFKCSYQILMIFKQIYRLYLNR